MYKDIIISVLAAVLLMRHPWYVGCTGLERAAVIMGTAEVVFIFLLFLEDLYEKWRNYRERVREIRRLVKKLREEKYR